MNEEVIYSPMTEADIPSVLKIQDECELSPWSENSYKEALTNKDSILYTARVAQTPIAFTAARLITVEALCEILNICVNAKYRRKKIGEALLLKIFSLLKDDIRSVWLEVREGNQGAIAFYKKQGFAAVGTRKNFYRDPVENALLMRKDII